MSDIATAIAFVIATLSGGFVGSWMTSAHYLHVMDKELEKQKVWSKAFKKKLKKDHSEQQQWNEALSEYIESCLQQLKVQRENVAQQKEDV